MEAEKVHEWVNTYESFIELLVNTDGEEHAEEILDAVGTIGENVQAVYGVDLEELDDRDVGWLYVIWEYRQERERTESQLIR